MKDKKLTLMIISLAMILAVYSFGRTRTVGNTFQAGDETYGMELNTDGSLVPMTSGTGALGNSTYKWDAVLDAVTATGVTAETVTATSGVTLAEIEAKCDTWDNLPAKSSCSITGGSNIVITTATCVANKYYLVFTDLTQPAFCARSLRVQLDGATASSATIVIEGLDARGNRITETGTIHSEIFETRYCFSVVYGSTISITVGGDATLALSFGNGDYIGLLGDISATSKLYKAVVQTSTTKVDETSSVTADATYDKWTHSDVPDGADDFYIFYRTDSE